MKNFFMSLCAVLISYGCAGFIKNSGKTAKMTHFIFALCVICSFISLLPRVDLALPTFSSSGTAEYTNTELSEEVFTKTLENLLSGQSITFEKIEVTSSKNKDGSITINKIRVQGASDSEKAKEILKENTSVAQIEVNQD